MSSNDARTTRRTVLKTVGGTAVGLSIAAGAASADHEHPEVETGGVTDISQHAATLHGEVTAFGEGAGGAYVWFEWDHAFSNDYSNSTDRLGMLAPGSFSHSLRGLEADTHYKYRAVAEDTDDGDRDYGDGRTFVTEAEDGEPVK